MKKLKKFFAVLLGVLLVSVNFVNAENNNQSSLSTTEKTILSWLKSDEDKSKFLNDFNKLSKEEQQKFLEYLNNPETIFKWLKNWNKDIKLKRTISKKYIKRDYTTSRNWIYSNKAVYNDRITIFNIDILIVEAWVRYQHDGYNIIRINNWNGYVVKHLIPLSDYTYSWHTTRIDWDRAYFMMNIEFKFIHRYIWGNYSVLDLWVWWDTRWNAWWWSHVDRYY